jgi:hypothetical protein
MWQDPIVTETRALREKYAEQFGHDADAIFQDILHRQNVPGKKLVTFPARKPIVEKAPAQQGASADARTSCG